MGWDHIYGHDDIVEQFRRALARVQHGVEVGKALLRFGQRARAVVERTDAVHRFQGKNRFERTKKSLGPGWRPGRGS